MEIRTRSKAGSLVPSVGEITTKLSQQVDAMKPQWLDQLARDPASFARIEVEIHDHFRHLADQMTASLLAEATASGEPPESGKKGGPAGPTDRDAPRRCGG
jgi:hypothetical protein